MSWGRQTQVHPEARWCQCRVPWHSDVLVTVLAEWDQCWLKWEEEFGSAWGGCAGVEVGLVSLAQLWSVLL